MIFPSSRRIHISDGSTQLGGNAWAKVRTVEWLGILFFPFGVILGLGLAWWREALGAAAAAVGSVTAFYLSQVLLVGRLPSGPWFLIFSAPAVLFFASWIAHRRRCETGLA